MRRFVRIASLIVLLLMSASAASAAEQWLTFEGADGPGRGKHVVLVSGDEEYRSEEALPQLARILAKHHGFKCTVLFAIDPSTGNVDPNVTNNIPGLEALDQADLMIIATRFRDLPDEQMKHIVDYVESGRPVIGMRTATHAFNFKTHKSYARYSNGSKEWDGGFGRQVLGEQWISHHGKHKFESTLGLVAPGMESHPILRGIKSGDIWGPTDVYGVRLPQPEGCQALVLGQVLSGMQPTDPPVEGTKNDPMMPVAWIKTFQAPSGKPARVFNTTMGSSTDLECAALRRLLVNATYWAVGLEQQIPDNSKVDLVGVYEPHPYSFNGAVKGQPPAYFAR